MSAMPELAEFFRSVDAGEKRYIAQEEERLHNIHEDELKKLICEKEINNSHDWFIYEIHFSAMEQRIMGKTPTTSYRRGIRHFKNADKNIVIKIEKILKVVKDYDFCDNSQLKLFLNFVKLCMNNTNYTEDDINILITNWSEEITPDEQMIIKNNLF